MMNNRVLNIMVGIPGSGKSTYIKKNAKKEDYVICPDQIRKEITGDISDQSQNRKVWIIAYQLLKDCKADTVYFDATNLTIKTLSTIIENASDFDTINLLLMSASFKRVLCKNRVKADVENKVERAHVPDDIIDVMQEKFLDFTKNIDNWITDYQNSTGKVITYKYING